MKELEDKHESVAGRFHALDNKQFNEPYERRFTKFFPTVGDTLMFMCITHEAMHLAQVAPGDGQ